MSNDLINHYIKQFFSDFAITVQPYPDYPYGKKLIDSSGDYLIVFFNTETNHVMHFFQGAEAYWFSYE